MSIISSRRVLVGISFSFIFFVSCRSQSENNSRFESAKNEQSDLSNQTLEGRAPEHKMAESAPAEKEHKNVPKIKPRKPVIAGDGSSESDVPEGELERLDSSKFQGIEFYKDLLKSEVGFLRFSTVKTIKNVLMDDEWSSEKILSDKEKASLYACLLDQLKIDTDDRVIAEIFSTIDGKFHCFNDNQRGELAAQASRFAKSEKAEVRFRALRLLSFLNPDWFKTKAQLLEESLQLGHDSLHGELVSMSIFMCDQLSNDGAHLLPQVKKLIDIGLTHKEFGNKFILRSFQFLSTHSTNDVLSLFETHKKDEKFCYRFLQMADVFYSDADKNQKKQLAFTFIELIGISDDHIAGMAARQSLETINDFGQDEVFVKRLKRKIKRLELLAQNEKSYYKESCRKLIKLVK